MAKDELLEVTPASVVSCPPVVEVPTGGGLAFEAVVEILDNDEFAELIRLSRASRSARSVARNFSYITWTSANSFLVSSNSA